MRYVETGFPHIGDMEEQAVSESRARIAAIEAQIGLGKAVARIQNQPGWQDYIKALSGRRDECVQKLQLCDGPDHEVRILQGRCREIEMVMNMVANADRNLDGFDGMLKAEQLRQQELMARVRKET